MSIANISFAILASSVFASASMAQTAATVKPVHKAMTHTVPAKSEQVVATSKTPGSTGSKKATVASVSKDMKNTTKKHTHKIKVDAKTQARAVNETKQDETKQGGLVSKKTANTTTKETIVKTAAVAKTAK